MWNEIPLTEICNFRSVSSFHIVRISRNRSIIIGSVFSTGRKQNPATMDSNKQTTLFTNLTVCDHCEKGHTTKKAVIQHLANSGCISSTICYCRQKVTNETAADHMLKCRFFGPIGCTLCPDRLFKSLEKGNNHAWSAHGGGRWTPIVQDTVDFKMKAQIGTRFA
jgi:hypothetical protein